MDSSVLLPTNESIFHREEETIIYAGENSMLVAASAAVGGRTPSPPLPLPLPPSNDLVQYQNLCEQYAKKVEELKEAMAMSQARKKTIEDLLANQQIYENRVVTLEKENKELREAYAALYSSAEQKLAMATRHLQEKESSCVSVKNNVLELKAELERVTRQLGEAQAKCQGVARECEAQRRQLNELQECRSQSVSSQVNPAIMAGFFPTSTITAAAAAAAQNIEVQGQWKKRLLRILERAGGGSASANTEKSVEVCLTAVETLMMKKMQDINELLGYCNQLLDSNQKQAANSSNKENTRAVVANKEMIITSATSQF